MEQAVGLNRLDFSKKELNFITSEKEIKECDMFKKVMEVEASQKQVSEQNLKITQWFEKGKKLQILQSAYINVQVIFGLAMQAWGFSGFCSSY